MLRLIKLAWLTVVAIGGVSMAVVTFFSDDASGSLVILGIALLLCLAVFLLPESDRPRRQKHGFEPHRRR